MRKRPLKWDTSLSEERGVEEKGEGRGGRERKQQLSIFPHDEGCQTEKEKLSHREHLEKVSKSCREGVESTSLRLQYSQV